MNETALPEILGLERRSLTELKERYRQLYPEAKVAPSHKQSLIRAIAWKLQEQEHGGLSEEAKTRLSDLTSKLDPVNNLFIRKTAQPKIIKPAKGSRDNRLPLPGTVLTKHYKEHVVQVKVLEKGFEYNGKAYRTLSKIANEITGGHRNGFAFFGMEHLNDK